MQEAVLQLDIHCEKAKQKAMSTVCCLSGITSVTVKDDKLTVKGEIDAYMIVKKLKKICHTKIISVGSVKEPEKKPEEKKAEAEKKPPPEVIYQYMPPYPPHFYQHCVYEDPNSCVIL